MADRIIIFTVLHSTFIVGWTGVKDAPCVNLYIQPLYRFTDCMRPCVVRIRSVGSLLGEVESLREQKYSQENTDHEKLLHEVRIEHLRGTHTHTHTHTHTSCGRC